MTVSASVIMDFRNRREVLIALDPIRVSNSSSIANTPWMVWLSTLPGHFVPRLVKVIIFSNAAGCGEPEYEEGVHCLSSRGAWLRGWWLSLGWRRLGFRRRIMGGEEKSVKGRNSNFHEN